MMKPANFNNLTKSAHLPVKSRVNFHLKNISVPVVVFDMDDTLYDEMTYVKSGFYQVSNFLYENWGLDKVQTLEQMLYLLKINGRGAVFNDLLKFHGLYSKANIKKCLIQYRMHIPEIALSKSAEACLGKLKKYFSLYLVTDGNKIVQKKKVQALNLSKYMAFCYLTHRYGKIHSKPSAYVFEKICEREKVPPHQVVYVGDNPHKDFVGINKKGFKTIRLLKGPYKEIKKNSRYNAFMEVKSLDALTVKLIWQITQKEN